MRVHARPTLLRGVVALLLAAASSITVPGAPAASAAPGEATTRFVPVRPCRLLDTRGDAAEPGAPLPAGHAVDLDVAGRCDVDDDAIAAALTVTAVDAGGPGYVTLYPGGTERPTASTLNYGAGDVVANMQLTRLGDGAVTAFTLASAHLVVDVTGYFETVSSARSGRFVPLAGGRLVDTRTTQRPTPGSSVTVDTGAAGVPADAGAVVVNLTTDQTTGPDVFIAHPTGTSRPTASSLNADRAGQARAAAAIVPVDDARFDVFTRNGNHVIVDLLGYFTGGSADVASDGLFVPVDPFRLVDTRLAAGPAGGPRLWDTGGREFAVDPDVLGAPAQQVAALAVNATVTDTEDAGWVALAAAGVPVPGTSSVNYPSAQLTVANGAFVAVSERGIQARALSGTHVVVDVTGWFTGGPAEAVEAPPTNDVPPPRKVTIITDSALAGVRWSGGLQGLQGFVVDHRMESCRRLVAPSCRGREGYRPRTVVSEIAALPPVGPEDLLVIGTGYDDWWQRFSGDFDTVIAAARAKGFRHIAWTTFRSNVTYAGLGPYYAIMNDVLRAKVASGDYPEVRIWDYHTYTLEAAGWFTSDGIHLTRLGAWGSADWISRQVAAYDDRACPQPWAPGEPVETPCPQPDPLAAERGLPDIVGLYMS